MFTHFFIFLNIEEMVFVGEANNFSFRGVSIFTIKKTKTNEKNIFCFTNFVYTLKPFNFFFMLCISTYTKHTYILNH